MFTRKDYLSNDGAPDGPAFNPDGTRSAFGKWSEQKHARYYGEIVNACGGPRAFRLPGTLQQLREAFAADSSFNPAPVLYQTPDGPRTRSVGFSLAKWACVSGPWARASAALKARGDYLTQAGKTCIAKQAARMLVESDPDGRREAAESWGDAMAGHLPPGLALAGMLEAMGAPPTPVHVAEDMAANG